MNSARVCAPLGDISIGIKCAPGVVGPGEADIDFDIIKNDNDTFTVKYTPPAPGRYTIMVLFAEQVKMQFQLFIFNCVKSQVDVLNLFFNRKFPSVPSKSKWIRRTMLAK